MSEFIIRPSRRDPTLAMVYRCGLAVLWHPVSYARAVYWCQRFCRGDT